MDVNLNYCDGCKLSPCGLSKHECELSGLDYICEYPINVFDLTEGKTPIESSR